MKDNCPINIQLQNKIIDFSLNLPHSRIKYFCNTEEALRIVKFHGYKFQWIYFEKVKRRAEDN